jgi:hypothetical protein
LVFFSKKNGFPRHSRPLHVLLPIKSFLKIYGSSRPITVTRTLLRSGKAKNPGERKLTMGMSRARGAGFRFWGAGFRIQASGLRQTSGFSLGRCCGGEAGPSCDVLYVFKMRSQRRLNGGGTRPVLQVRARWVPDLGGFRFYCTHTSGFSVTGCCGGKAAPSSTMRHIFGSPKRSL